MKRILSLLLILGMLGSISGCGVPAEEAASGGQKLSIVTTIFPEYDWVRSILGDQADRAELTMLLGSGVDLHSYQPSVDDIVKISTCDLFLYVGGESDSWVDAALAEADNQKMVVLNLMDVLGSGVKEEETVEGMEADDEEPSEGPAYDEHVWLSLKNAAVLVQAISDAIQTLDPDAAEAYRKNTDDYLKKLRTLDEAYQTAVDTAAQRTILFGDRFPFRYLTEDYGITYYAAFLGCSAETEASFETVVFLANKVDELGLTTILTLEGSDQKLARTILENTNSRNQAIAAMDSMQSTTSEQINAGVTYLSVMEKNLEVLRTAMQ